MNTPFLKKYQPRYFKDFEKDKEITDILNMLMNMNLLNILLIGSHGCGKTSLLDAIIREYYGTDRINKDNILYINNLKEQGIQYYRTEVKIFCQIPSTVTGKKKFIVLDDIDTINDQSQQVFRNCIDKYYNNVFFILSCTNTHKIIDSLQSRCTILEIKTIDKPFLTKILTNIIKNEKVSITDEAKKFILHTCNNSIRLLINYVEKFKLLDQPITLNLSKEICTNLSFFDFEKYTKAWFIEKNYKKAIKIIFSVSNKGYSVMDILDGYFTFIKITQMLDETQKYNIIKLICKYISLFHTLHEHDIELAFFTNELNKMIK
jgi:DNA polymerase III delta prime subunit